MPSSIRDSPFFIQHRYTTPMPATDQSDRVRRAILALEGLSLGDAFGECFFAPGMQAYLDERRLPEAPWFYTDDTMMAWSIVDNLTEHGTVDQDALAQRFAQRFTQHPNRGYGAAAIGLLERIGLGYDWRSEARALFGGEGSLGNGGAMRVAPVGGFFADDLERVVTEARASAEVTHAHPEGIAGAIAVAIATACAHQQTDGPTLLQQVLQHTPAGDVHDGLAQAAQTPLDTDPQIVATRLGSGQRVLATDTVPFAVWSAAAHLDNFEAALWQTAHGLGDVDTTCAIVGGIVALAVGNAGLPGEWLRRREPLED
jgi:ADP-ribosylglycohydrolase